MAIIDPDFQTMLEAQAKAMEGQQMPPLDLLPAEMVRAGYKAQRMTQDTRAPKDVTAQDLTIPGGAGDVACRLYTPPGAGVTSPGLVYFHGGGFVIGDLDTHDGHCRRLASYAGVRVLSVDYRLAPEHPFPAGHDDALAVTKWVFDHAEGLGFDPHRIAVGGDSAGGNLAASVALDLRGDPKRKLAFQLLLYPGIWPPEETRTRKERDGPLLTREALAWFEKHLAVGEHPERHRAGLGWVEDLSGAPPALVVTAGHDPLEDEGKDFAAALNAAGVKAEVLHYDDLIHDFYTLGDISPRVEDVTRETAAKLKAGLG